MILDPSDVKPEGYDDIPSTIPDPGNISSLFYLPSHLSPLLSSLSSLPLSFSPPLSFSLTLSFSLYLFFFSHPHKHTHSEAAMPGDWDEEDDGEWEPPAVDNPQYSVN